MIDWKKLGKKLLFPPIWLIIILTVISAATLVFVFVKGLEEHPVAYAVYVIAFYTLSVICILCYVTLPKHYKVVKQKIYGNKYGNRYLTDATFRTHISLYISLGVNLLYVAANIISGFLYHTYWFTILAGYYIILAVMRFILLRYVNGVGIGKNMLGEWSRSRVCACILTLINFSLSGVVLMMMYRDRGFVYNGILIYVMALYAFYITTLAIINIVKYRKYKSPIQSTTKIITLAAALVSMLSLETAMFNAFGADMAPENKRLMIALTGAGISIAVLVMSGYWIVRSTNEIKKLKQENENE